MASTTLKRRSISSPRWLPLLAVTLFLSLTLGMGGVAHAAPVTGFNSARIIDDGVFTNSNSMNAVQIQAFLSNKVSSCDTNGALQATEYGSTLTHAQYAASRGWSAPPYTCLRDYSENGLSAAQIIYNTAQQYQINPQVLIVLLQKEQGLVTDTWPLATQYRTATGYGCPDTAGCDTKYYGFTNQLHWSGTMFRAILDNSPTWSTPYILGSNFIQYNPSSSCGGSTVNIQNRSTQALYNYTPYQPNQAALNAAYGTGDSCSAYGNRNFYLYFTDWFGSTQFPQPLGGSLYVQQSNGMVFLINDSTRFYIPDWNTMVNYGLDAYPMQSVSDTVIQSLTNGGALTNLIWDSSGVYLVNNKRIHHVSGEACIAWGFSCFDGTKVKSLGSAFKSQYLVQGGDLSNLSYANNTAYRMTAGLKQPIANTKTLTDIGLNPAVGLVASALNSNQPLGTLLMTTPGVVQFTPNGALYYYDGLTYFKTNNSNSFIDWSIDKITQISVPLSSYAQTPPPSTLLSTYITYNSQKYLVDQGRKILIPTNLVPLWQSISFVTPPVDLFNRLLSETLNSLVWADPNIYYLSGGQKHYVATYDDFIGIQADVGAPTNIRLDKLAVTAQGSDAIVDGQIINLTNGDGKLYVTNNHRLTYIPNVSVFDAYGFNWGGIREYPASITVDYPINSSAVLGAGIVPSGTHFIVARSSLYQLSDAQSKDFGTIDAQFTQITNRVVKRSSPSLSRFLYNTDTGKIYYASGGNIHYVASYSAFVAYGGLTNPASLLDSTSISLFTEAQPVY